MGIVFVLAASLHSFWSYFSTDLQHTELTYTSNDSALFILPDEGKMQDLEAKLTPEMLTRW